jgi:hypothetical protein
VTLALTYHSESVPEDLHVSGNVTFAPGPTIDPIASSDLRAVEMDGALKMHFDDDTLGEFVGFRSGIRKDAHPIVPHLRGTLWALGWREAELGEVDKGIRDADYNRGSGRPRRYAHKYAWIGLYLYPGMRDYYRRSWDDRRPADVQIDPSFPEAAPPAPIAIPMWTQPKPRDDRLWIRRGKITVPDSLFYVRDLGSYSGPWIAACGSLSSRTKIPNRDVFGLLTALLVDAKEADRLVDALNTKDYPGNLWLPRVPEDYYTFGGEIPWNPDFAREIESERGQMYRSELEVPGGSPIEVEILAHDFGWESYHSELNQAGHPYVPSRLFSRTCDLRGVPQSFDQQLPDGTRASISLKAPIGFEGHLLYLREDLVKRYASGRKLIWFIWGERNLYGYSHGQPPEWWVKAHRERAMIWRRVVRGEELSHVLASKNAGRAGRATRRSPTQK